MNNINILFAGFGGQGILFAGKFLAYKACLRARKFPGFPLTDPKCAAAPQTAVLS